MNYQIQSRQDPLEGVSLVVSIPEGDLDEKAFYTLKYTMPPFLIPFHHRSVDGQIELIYQLGGYNRLRYFYGEKTLESYVQMWERLLQPLLDCKDWFLSPLSFCLNEEYLYQSKDGVVSYLYIPAKKECCFSDELKGMVVQLVRNNHVNDPKIENIVLGMLVQDFRPDALLDELRKVQMPTHPTVHGAGDHIPAAKAVVHQGNYTPEPVPAAASVLKPVVPPPSREGDIVIKISSGEEKEKKQSGFSLFGRKDKSAPKADKVAKKEKKEKEKKEKKEKQKKGKNEEKPFVLPQAQVTALPPQPAPPVYPVPSPAAMTGGDETQWDDDGTHLKLIGLAGLPMMIPVNIGIGEVFTIGRHDVTVGLQQSSFEFREDTKAVSRHHAAIERDAEGYTITDIQSKAGTFLDGEPLQPNMPYRLRRNMRISFGNGGADYLWEE